MVGRFLPVCPANGIVTAQLNRLHFRSGLRLLLLIALITLLQPDPLLIVPGPPQTVQTSHPIVGVHTRLTDEVEEWKIQRSLEMVRQMGSPWIVELFPWAYYHAADGGIAWDHPDMVINHAHAQGLKVIARIGLTPGWARPPDTPLNYLDATAYDDFAEFAARFAARYEGKLAAIIVGNEPNLSYEWGYREGTAVDYTNLLKTVYPAVKAANPDVLVLGGALAPTLEPAGSPWGLNDLEYLDQMYAAGAADYFDGLAVHSYGLTFPALADPGPEILNFRRVELVRQVMLRHKRRRHPNLHHRIWLERPSPLDHGCPPRPAHPKHPRRPHLRRNKLALRGDDRHLGLPLPRAHQKLHGQLHPRHAGICDQTHLHRIAEVHRQ
jgi:hypothetical protein